MVVVVAEKHARAPAHNNRFMIEKSIRSGSIRRAGVAGEHQISQAIQQLKSEEKRKKAVGKK